jgi:hypothetical protein
MPLHRDLERRHCALRCVLQFHQSARLTSLYAAMEEGIENSAWTVSDLVNAA